MKKSSKLKPGESFSIEGLWELYFDFFDLCYPDLQAFSLVEINPNLILILCDEQRVVISRDHWMMMDFKEKVLMKIGLIHKILDQKDL